MPVLNSVLSACSFGRLGPGDSERLGEFLEGLSAETYKTFHPYSLTKESAQRALAEVEGPVIAAVDDSGGILGYAWFHPEADAYPSVGICIADRARGQGIGKALMRELQADARGKGRSGLMLWVVKRNDAAVRLYRSVGFQVIGETEYDFEGERLESHVMRWEATEE